MRPSGVPPEAAVLFLLAGGPRNDAAMAAALAQVDDWPALLAAAVRERAMTTLRDALTRTRAPVPAAVRAHVEQFDRVSRFRMLYLQTRVLESCEALRTSGIRAVLLKGAAVASSVYGSFAERPMVDVDLLVRPDDASRAVEVLLRTGWQWHESKARDADYSQLHHLPAFQDSRGMDLSLELHTALFPQGHPFSLSGDDLLDSAMPVRRDGAVVLVPGREHQLIHAATHFVWSHLLRSSGFRTMQDVGRILDVEPIDWGALAALARRTRSATCCYWTLRLTQQLAAVPIPDAALDALRPPIPRWLEGRLLRYYASIMLPLRRALPPITVRRMLWTLGLLPRWSGHGSSRPWDVLALAPRDAARRLSTDSPRRSRTGRWTAYLRDLLPLSLAVKPHATSEEEL